MASPKTWADSVRIRYELENPKQSGGLSHARYEKYKVATTIGEALQLGAGKGDLVYDFQKGYLERTGCGIKRKTPSQAHEPVKTVSKKKKAKKTSANAKVDMEDKQCSGSKKVTTQAKKDKLCVGAKKVATQAKDKRKKLGVSARKVATQAKVNKELFANAKKVETKAMVEKVAIGPRRDVPLPAASGCGKLWDEMQKAGWRYCEFQYLSGIRSGMPYCRFVKPSGGTINNGIVQAIAIYAKQNNLDLQALLKSSGRQEVLDEAQNKKKLSATEREESIQAYREMHGRVKTIPEGWTTEQVGNRFKRLVMVSPDGCRCGLFTDVEAYYGSRMIGLRK